MCCEWAGTLRRQRLRLLHVGRIVAGGAINDGVFAGGGNHLELFREVATDSAAVGRHGAVPQAKAVEDGAVSRGHGLIAEFGRFQVAVKTVGIFHDEFARTHHAKTRAAFVAELGLYVVKIARQLFVTFDLLARDVGHHLFAGRLDDEVAVMPVFHA